MPIETIRESLKGKKKKTKKPLKVCINYVKHRASCTRGAQSIRPVYIIYKYNITEDFDFLLTS